MDRPIKFRAWVLNDHGDWMAQQGVHHEIDTASKFLALYGEDILMQYTGLHDKNGTEIYEGDILKSHDGLDDLYQIIDKVIFKNGSFIVDPITGFTTEYLSDIDKYDREVIGNIYESPELLEGVADGS